VSVHTPGDAGYDQHTHVVRCSPGCEKEVRAGATKSTFASFCSLASAMGIAACVSPRADDAGGSRPSVVTLPGTIESSRCAREHVTRFVAEQHLDGARDDLRIIVSELVANAVMHGRAPIALTLAQHDGTVRVEVTDGAADLDAVHLREIDSPTVGGRGLRILSALADAWGIAATAHGKSVWATYVVASARHE